MMHSSSLSSPSILIVDDTLENLHMLSALLSQAGYKVQVTNSGEQALTAVKAQRPTLILLDIMMPKMNGFEVCKHLKADAETCEIPVIFISARDAIEDKVKALTIGGVDYITKPFHVKEVLARIRTHLDLHQARIDLEQKNRQLEQEIAERRQAERMLNRYTERLRILHEIDQSILAAESPGAIALAAIGRIRQLIPCQRAIALAVTEGGSGVEILAVESDGEIQAIDTRLYHEMLREQPISDGLVQGSNDLDATALQSPLLQALYAAGARSYIAVPLFVHGELVGSLNLEANRPRVFTADHVTIVNEVAIVLAVALRQAQLYEQTQQERQKSEALLTNILPASVANALKEKGQVTPRGFENVTVFFSDIVNFMDIASQQEPVVLIDELNEIFTAFDTIMEQNHCERIKTIGDAYLAVCGMPEENENHAYNIIQAAYQVVEYLENRNKHVQIPWQIRIGVHSGHVVGGVVGIKKYIYDVFGDAVNTAARMESYSEPMRVNVSEATHTLVGDDFPFTERGVIEVKGKGKMRMYFLDMETQDLEVD